MFRSFLLFFCYLTFLHHMIKIFLTLLAENTSWSSTDFSTSTSHCKSFELFILYVSRVFSYVTFISKAVILVVILLISLMKDHMVFFCSMKSLTFILNLCLLLTLTQRKQIWSFDGGETHTHSTGSIRWVSIQSSIHVKDSQMQYKIPVAGNMHAHSGIH